MNTPTELEARITAALAARAEQVRPEHLEPTLAPVVALRRRRTRILLAAAACVLLAAGLTLWWPQDEDRVDPAPKPSETEIVIPPDVGRDWEADDLATPARLDLDGDGVKEQVEFLAEKTKNFDGRLRIQTVVSSTGEEAYGIAELGSTIGTSALEPIDADDDGDQELVLLRELDQAVVGGLYAPAVFDLRDGLLVQAVADDAELLARGNVTLPGSRTDHYELVRSHDFWMEDGSLFSSSSVDTFASGNMTLLRPEFYVADVHAWSLHEDGTLRPDSASCLVISPEAQMPCDSGADEGVVPYINSVATETIPEGEWVDFEAGYPFRAMVEPGQTPTLVVDGSDGGELRFPLEVPDPEVSTEQPMSIFSDGASFIVTSASDPSIVSAVVQRGDSLTPLVTTGEVSLADEGTRTWQSANGALVTVTAREDGSWTAWSWQMVSRTEMAALPWGTVCFDDVDDPTTAHSC